MENNEKEQIPAETQRGSTHIYAYTALIFVVAILMILLAFFGQTNVKKEEHITTEGKSITERSAALSNENLGLRDRIDDLIEQLEAKDAEILAESEVNSVYQRIFSAQVLCDVGNFAEAKNVLDTIDGESLTGDAKTIYEKLIKTITSESK